MIWRPGRQPTTLKHVPSGFPLLTSWRLIWWAGVALIAVGVLCLCLSGAVVGPGWWQGTLDAFGVGFIVGGVVDVLALSLLNQVISGAAGEPYLNWRAKRLIQYGEELQLRNFLRNHGDEIDPLLRIQLKELLLELGWESKGPPGSSISIPPDLWLRDKGSRRRMPPNPLRRPTGGSPDDTGFNSRG
jgi:hypothetical protein